MSVRDINRMIGQYQRERWTEGKAQRSTDISFESHAAARCLILNGKKSSPFAKELYIIKSKCICSFLYKQLDNIQNCKQ